MAFKLAKNRAFSVRITVNTPNEKAGFDRSALLIRYRRPDVDESLELQKLTPREAMDRVVIGWEEFNDEDNEPVPYSDATRWALLNDPPALLAINDGFWLNAVKAREKN
jgi:hypothetical protein